MSLGFNEPAGLLLLLLLLMRVPLSHDKDFLHSLVNLLRIGKLSLLHLLPARRGTGVQLLLITNRLLSRRMCRVRICNCDQHLEILMLEKKALNNEYCF